MFIKELPLHIRQLALANQVAQGNRANEDLDLQFRKDQGNFNWGVSNEGYDFWLNIYEVSGKEQKHSCIDKSTYIDLLLPYSGDEKINELISMAEERDLVKKAILAGLEPDIVLSKFRNYVSSMDKEK